MSRYVTVSVDVELDMREIGTKALEEELARRRKRKEEDSDLPMNNLDFKMKLELFMDAWDKMPFTELRDRLK